MPAKKAGEERPETKRPAANSAKTPAVNVPTVSNALAANGPTGREAAVEGAAKGDKPQKKVVAAKSSTNAPATTKSKTEESESKPKAKAFTPKAENKANTASKPQKAKPKDNVSTSKVAAKSKTAMERTVKDDIEAELAEEFKDRDAAFRFRTQIEEIADKMLSDAFETTRKHLQAASKDLKKIEDEAQKKSDEKVSEEESPIRKSSRRKRAVVEDSDDDKDSLPSPKKARIPARKNKA